MSNAAGITAGGCGLKMGLEMWETGRPGHNFLSSFSEEIIVGERVIHNVGKVLSLGGLW